MKLLLFDLEVSTQKHITNIGAVNQQGNLIYKGKNIEDFCIEASKYDVLAGHNIINFDMGQQEFPTSLLQKPTIDTIRLSSLIFIRNPYHKLIKTYKEDTEYLDGFRESSTSGNDPVQDSRLSLELFQECVQGFQEIPQHIQQVLFALIGETKQFKTFFQYLQHQHLFQPQSLNLHIELQNILSPLLQADFFGAPLQQILKKFPLAFTYIFRLLQIKLAVDKDFSVFPGWIIHNLPEIHTVFQTVFKHKLYDSKKELKRLFQYDDFRSYPTVSGSDISQQEIIQAGLNDEDFLAILATGGGKSLCFQLPALMKAEGSSYLTIVISPLQSLMKDQTDNLMKKKHLTNVGFLNGSLNPLERKEVAKKVEFGGIDLLYLSPEMLRSFSIQNILSKRLIDRIVIDEAHCFSKRGHDFRIDYMFIADFIKELGKKNKSLDTVSISCFTATAKQEVADEIKTYFKEHFNKELKEFRSTAKRGNLSYKAYELGDKNSSPEKIEHLKFQKLVEILEHTVQGQPCIIFTRFRGKSEKVGAQNLSNELNARFGFNISAYYHGDLKSDKKREMMDSFMEGNIKIIVATNAFGMGVDKGNVRFVIHYDMPTSVENYLQEAGRAGRDGELSQCIILYNSQDLDENLQLNKSSEVREKEIKALRTSIKNRFGKLIKTPKILSKSAKELIKDAGWIKSEDFEKNFYTQKPIRETKVKTAFF